MRPTDAALGPVRVFVAGTFDGLHVGHLHLFEFARRQGERLARRLKRSGVHLAVTVARDDSVRRIKGRRPFQTQDERRRLIVALRPVDEAFVGHPSDFLRSIRRTHPDLIVLGYDQSGAWEEILRRFGVTVPVVRCTEYGRRRLKSSLLREDLVRLPT